MGILFDAIKRLDADVEPESVTLKACPICGKQFVPAPYHYWKIGTEDSFDSRTIRVCSYSCMRKWEKENRM